MAANRSSDSWNSAFARTFAITFEQIAQFLLSTGLSKFSTSNSGSGIRKLLAILAALLPAALTAQSTTFYYTSASFDVAACTTYLNSLPAPPSGIGYSCWNSGNVTGSVTFNNLPPGFTGVVSFDGSSSGATIESYTFMTSNGYTFGPGQDTYYLDFTFQNGSIVSWDIGISFYQPSSGDPAAFESYNRSVPGCTCFFDEFPEAPGFDRLTAYVESPTTLYVYTGGTPQVATWTQSNLQITTTSLPDAVVGQPYSVSLVATGGSGMGYVWSIASGSSDLPAGFTLSPDGVLSSSGDPAASEGPTTFTVQVMDSASNTATQQLTLNVDPLEDAEQLGDTCPCGLSQGDPITITNGNVFEQVTDYRTASANKLSFTRYYNSLTSTATFAVSLGKHWRSTYDRYLNLISSTALFAERADGQGLFFTLNGGVWSSNSDIDVKLVQSGSIWTLTDHEDTVETYTTNSSGTEALLNSIQARGGYTQTLAYNASNQLASVTDSYNRTLTFTYSGTQLQTVSTPDNLVLTYGFGTNGALASVSYNTTPVTNQSYLYANASFPFALTSILDENGNTYSSWTYDSQGRGLTSQLGSGANLTAIAYDDTTGNRTVTNALGEQELYKFATLQGVPKIVEIDRLATSTTVAATRKFTYDANGYTASSTDWNGNLTTYVNDVHGQPTTIAEPGRTTTITYLSNYHLPSQIVTQGLTTTFAYDTAGDLLTKTLTDTTTTIVPYTTQGTARTWTYTWSNFLMASAKGPRTDVSQLTTFTYDSSGTLTQTTNALGQTTKVTSHTPGGLPLTTVDSNGVATTLTYDARLRLLTSTLSTTGGPLTTSYTYDAAGNLLKTTLPDGSALRNAYDAAHRLTGITDLFNQNVAYTLDALGDRTQTTITNASAVTQRQHSANFDALGRVLHDIGGVGQTTAYAYDSNGNALTVTDPLSHITQQAFDSSNRLIRTIDAGSGITKSTYDQHDRPVTVVDPNSGSTTYVYDGFGDVIQRISPDTGKTVYQYDLAGNLTQSVDATGATANYTYDALNRVLSTTYPSDASENVAYAYDQTGHGFGIGRLTGVTDAVGTLGRTYDERGNVLTEQRSLATTTLLTSYAYDKASRIASISYPSGWFVSYTRDIMGRITAVNAQPQGGSPQIVASGIAYEPFGPVNGLTYGNAISETRSYDLDYRMTHLVGTGTTALQNLTYGYDAGNNVLSIADGVTAGNSQTLGYDVMNRLTSAAGSYGTLGYTYTAIGNRASQTVNGVTSNYTYTAHSSQLTAIKTGSATQAVGNTSAGSVNSFSPAFGQVSGLAYNQAGRLASTTASGSPITQYTYDAFGHRLVKVGTSTGETLYQYDSAGHLLEEASGTAAPQVDYIYLDDRPIATIQASNNKIYFLHDDRLGTPQSATDSTQAIAWTTTYQPFGQTSSLPMLIAQDLRFPGQENDLETGLYHNGFRDYVPVLGRYLETDPIGLAGGVNAYAYVSGNPLTHFDASGLTDIFGFGGAGSGRSENTFLFGYDTNNTGFYTGNIVSGGGEIKLRVLSIGGYAGTETIDGQSTWILLGNAGIGPSFSWGNLNLGLGGFLNGSGEYGLFVYVEAALFGGQIDFGFGASVNELFNKLLGTPSSLPSRSCSTLYE